MEIVRLNRPTDDHVKILSAFLRQRDLGAMDINDIAALAVAVAPACDEYDILRAVLSVAEDPIAEVDRLAVLAARTPRVLPNPIEMRVTHDRTISAGIEFFSIFLRERRDGDQT